MIITALRDHLAAFVKPEPDALGLPWPMGGPLRRGNFNRAAMIYQHEARGADAAITGGIDAHVQAERGRGDDGTTARPGSLVPAG